LTTIPRAALIAVTALVLAGCASSAAGHSAATKPASTAPAVPPVARSQRDTSLCRAAKIVAEVRGPTPVTAKQAGLLIINTLLQNVTHLPGTVSATLKTDVTAWALALSTDLSAGQTTSPGTAAALRAVARDCAQIY